MNKICSNSKITGCQGIVTERGTILCATCIEARKNAKHNNERDLENLISKNKEMETELNQLRETYKNAIAKYEETIKTVKQEPDPELNKYKIYSNQLEKELEKQSERIAKLLHENERLEAENKELKITIQQLKIEK